MSKSMKLMALTASITLMGQALACSENSKGGFLPENDAYIPVEVQIPGPTTSQDEVNQLLGLGSRHGVSTEAQFNQAIDKIEAVYAPIIASMGEKLKITRLWADGTVNAYAMQYGSMEVLIYGGLARHKAITKDGLSLIVCHEIGHHIGGAPKKIGGPVVNWASNEGQADYFATLKCLRKAWINDNNQAIVRSLSVPSTVKDLCKRAHGNDEIDAALCMRTSMAGKSVADLFSSMARRGQRKKAKFTTPDSRIVWATNDDHPEAQCRLDTYFQGSLCDVGMQEDVSQTDEVKATCHGSLGHRVGKRPLCWFKPLR